MTDRLIRAFMVGVTTEPTIPTIRDLTHVPEDVYAIIVAAARAADLHDQYEDDEQRVFSLLVNVARVYGHVTTRTATLHDWEVNVASALDSVQEYCVQSL